MPTTTGSTTVTSSAATTSILIKSTTTTTTVAMAEATALTYNGHNSFSKSLNLKSSMKIYCYVIIIVAVIIFITIIINININISIINSSRDMFSTISNNFPTEKSAVRLKATLQFRGTKSSLWLMNLRNRVVVLSLLARRYDGRQQTSDWATAPI